jgi:aspartyl-tRNA(Asn)/glutamyl-tRNA(Gln) amidotransferase subunit A
MTSFAPKTPLAVLSARLDRGDTSSRELVDTALARIEAAGGNGGAAFCHVDAAQARAQADAADAWRRAGTPLSRWSPLAGLPVSIKDLFDVEGQPTRAGSTVLSDVAPAVADAPVVARLRQAGAILIGRTNMSEFAFSGMGLNPHYGSPASPWKPEERRVSGGSSSGAAVSVAMGMAAVGLGTDTGGSLRIPAAFCGITGFKPTARRIPTAGGIPLSTTLDSFGAIAPTVACCAVVDRILAGVAPVVPAARSMRGTRFAVLSHLVNEQLEPEVAEAYQAGLSMLSAAGASLIDVRFEALGRLPAINGGHGGFSPIEAWWYHREWIRKRRDQYDARVLSRILRGEGASAADYLDLIAARERVIAEAEEVFQGFDAILMPTAPILPPRISALENDSEAFFAANALALRNPSLINFLDGCALSIPLPSATGAPVGLMVAGLRGEDDKVLSVGLGVEGVFLTGK